MKNKKNLFKSFLVLIFIVGISSLFISCDEGYTKKDYKEKDWYKEQNGIVDENKEKSTKEKAEVVGIASVMEFKKKPYPNTEEGKKAEFGEELINETYNYFQDDAGNNLNNELACASCHIAGGTQAYGIPFVGITNFFPAFMKREDEDRSIEQRINGCFERSMDGVALDVESEEMAAMVAYMEHLSQDVKVDGERIEGQRTPTLDKLPDRRADLDKGEEVYAVNCAACHQADGSGMRMPNADKGFIYPPLWGEGSYNDGAGMHRLLTAAKFIKANMPTGTTFENPMLSDEEAYDVAAYINSFERPVKSGKENDFPVLSKKPKDAPFPPYYDEDISADQYKYGPFNW